MRKLTEDDRATIERMCPSRVNEDGYELELGQVMLAEIDRLRAELATMHRSVVHDCCVDKQDAEAAIARVRELCDVAHADCQEEFIPAMDGYVLFLKVDDVLRVLDSGE